MEEKKPRNKRWTLRIHEVIFEADTLAGKLFDLILIVAIFMSVTAVMLESVESVKEKYGNILYTMEWVFTILFTFEYIARIASLKKPKYYIFSFFGFIDLLSILPTYLSLLIAGTQAFLVLRIFRLLRIFRILKLVRFLGEANVLQNAIKASMPKIIVFIITVICISIITGTLMYIIEGPANGFVSIPISIYWTVVTLTTVGYGDIAPQTPIGQTLATLLMILGYGIIAVPTGIVTAQLSRAKDKPVSTQACPSCGAEGHEFDANYCKRCGSNLHPQN